MKPSYEGFTAQRKANFLELPPAGCYVAQIKDIRYQAPTDKQPRQVTELMIEITEGEYAGRYMDFYKEQHDRFGDTVKYKGVFRLVAPLPNDEDWRKRNFEANLWAVEQSNPGFHWNWDENELKGKKVGINVRNRLYTYNDKERSTTEIAQLEPIEDVKAGKCKPMKDRDQRSNDSSASTAPDGFTEVSTEVDVPW